MLHRAVVACRRWTGGGDLTLILWRAGDRVILSHEGSVRTTAEMTPELARELADELLAAAERPRGG